MAVSADVLGWVLVGLAVGLAATGLALWRLAGGAGARGGGGLVAVLAAVVVAALWPPLGWCGYGLLAGGLAVLLMATVRQPAWWAALAAGLGLWVARCEPTPALTLATGLALGAWIAALAVALTNAELDPREPVAWGTVVTATAVGAAFGLLREPSGTSAYLAPGVALAVGAAAAADPASKRPAPALLVAALLIAALTALSGAAWTVAGAAGLGLMAGLLLAGLPGDGPAPSGLRDGVLAALLVTATGAVAFGLARGLGVAVAALGVAGTACLSRREQDGPPPLAVAAGTAMLACWVLFRLVYERLPLSAGRADLYLHTVMVGMLIGMLLPVAVSVLRPRRADGPVTGAAELEAVATALVILAVGPVLLLMIWGRPALAGLVAGAPAGLVMVLALAPLTAALPDRPWSGSVGPAAGVMAAGAVAAGVSLTMLNDLGRVPKTVVLLVCLLVLGTYAALRLSDRPGESRHES